MKNYILNNEIGQMLDYIALTSNLEYTVANHSIYFYQEIYDDNLTILCTENVFSFKYDKKNFYDFESEYRINVNDNNQIDFLLDILNYFIKNKKKLIY